MLKKIAKLSTGLLLAVFLILATYGVNLSWNAHSNGKMTNCPFMGEMTQVCQMDIAHHITGWQKLFTAAFQSNALQALFISLLALVAVFWFFKKFQIFSPAYAFFTHRNQHRKKIEESPHNYLLWSLFDGILRKKE